LSQAQKQFSKAISKALVYRKLWQQGAVVGPAHKKKAVDRRCVPEDPLNSEKLSN
jgi:hypothetical protein